MFIRCLKKTIITPPSHFMQRLVIVQVILMSSARNQRSVLNPMPFVMVIGTVPTDLMNITAVSSAKYNYNVMSNVQFIFNSL